MLLLEQRHPSGADTMQIIRIVRAPVALIRSMAAAALPPVASIGSIISTKLSAIFGGSFEVIPRGDGRRLVALQADVAHPRRRQQFEHGVEHPQAGAEHRNDDDVRFNDAAVRRAERRSDDGGEAGTSRRSFRGQQHADRLARRNAGGAVRTSRSSASAS